MGSAKDRQAVSATAFKVGDRVKWTGQAQGYSKEHEGVITRIWGSSKRAYPLNSQT